MIAAVTLVVDATADARAKTLRPAAMIGRVACTACEGHGEYEFQHPDAWRMPRTVKCARCDGDGSLAAVPYESHDEGDDLTHVWASFDDFCEDRPAVCGRDTQDGRDHRVGADNHCIECWEALLAWRGAHR